MAERVLICFPCEDAPELQAEAAHLALGLVACGYRVAAIGAIGRWRHGLRTAGVTATDTALPASDRKLTHLIRELEPDIIHAFGAAAAHRLLPLTVLAGAGGVATLGHDDLPSWNPALFRTASAIFVPCDFLREQISRRLPATPVITSGYLVHRADPITARDARFLAEELGLTEGMPVVLMVDRYDGATADVALALIDGAAVIARHLPGVQVVIVGEGARLTALEQAASAMNDRLGYRAVVLPGPRDDVAQLLSLTAVAVGSGRFAMEALAAGVALVAVGPAGMIGTFTGETARVAQYTCCGRHGHLEACTARALAGDIVGLFAYPEYRERFAAEGQALALAHSERVKCAGEITAYYQHAAPTGMVMHAPQRVVAVLPDDLRALLFALPAISALRARYPFARVQLVSPPQHTPLLRRMQLAERVLTPPRGWRDWPAFLRAIMHPRADVCINFHSDPRSMLITGLTLARHRIGFTEGGASMVLSDHLTSRLPVSPERAVTLTQVVGVADPVALPVPEIPDELRQVIDTRLLAVGIGYEDPLILLCPESDEARAWPRAHWQALAALLARERGEYITVLDGGGDLALPAGVAPLSPVRDSLLLAALLARATLVIAADSGPLHLAVLLGVPTVGLYGPTSPRACALPNEYGITLCHDEHPCFPCDDATCAERACLRDLTPAEVAAAVTELLQPIEVT